MAAINKYISEAAQADIRDHIEQADGNEVFLVGMLDQEKVVQQVQLYARGNAFSAPALLQVARPGDVVIHNHPSGTLHPSGADNGVASILGNDSIGFYIVNNEVTEIYAVIEPFREKVMVPVKEEPLSAFFAPDGAFTQKLENYEHRPQQIEMLHAVSKSLNENKIAVIEAGTGTGKTLAYLLPNIVYSLNNEERIVISTNTINLQEQLINKDIPFLQTVLKHKFEAALVKGRTNYACKRKLAEAAHEPDLFSEAEATSELQEILAWAKNSKDGSKSDLNFVPNTDVWEKIQSESDTSLKTQCPFYQECFFYSARRKAAKANILVANHHLLFSDLAVRNAIGESENAILPTYDRVVLDEAHNIEDVATSYFGIRVTSLGVLRMLTRLYRKDKEREKGLLTYLSHKLMKHAANIPHEAYLHCQDEIQDHGVASVERLRLTLSVTMDRIFDAATALAGQEGGRNDAKIRLTEQVTVLPEWQQSVVELAQKLVTELRAFIGRLNGTLERIDRFKNRLGPAGLSLTVDLRAQLDRLSDVAASIEHVVLEQDATNVRWIETRLGYKDARIVRLYSSPLAVAPILRDTVFNRFKSVVLTSATLAVEGKFDYLKKQLGLDRMSSDRLLELQLAAPFDYERQALVAVPTDIPAPNEAGFVDWLTYMVHESIRISSGRAFVLFTSYGLLNQVFFKLSERINAMGYSVYKQGRENRHHLLERFKKDVSSVLFATDSFWEGVDVHGEALESVIITKLPFRVPSEPIIEARVEAIERRGGNAFYEYTVPQAAIKFKQGFGRLIRRKSDRGAILILDKRVVQKNYGRVFLNSLPGCRMAIGAAEDVLSALREFYRAA